MPIRRRRPSERAAGSRVHELFEEHGRMVYGLCHVLLGDPVEAEDATQQTFLLAFRALLDGQEPREARAWLATIARNECLGRVRSAAVRPRFFPEDADLPSARDTAAVAEGNDARTTVLEAVRELPPQQRDAFVLRELFGLSYEEIATALGVSRASVESLLFRARQRLQSDLHSVRGALGALVVPLSLQLPAAGGAAAAGGGLGSLAVVPTAAKLAAAAIAVGGAGTAAGVEVARHHSPAPTRAPAVTQPRPSVANAPPQPVNVAGVHASLPARSIPPTLPEATTTTEAVEPFPTESVETIAPAEEPVLGESLPTASVETETLPTESVETATEEEPVADGSRRRVRAGLPAPKVVPPRASRAARVRPRTRAAGTRRGRQRGRAGATPRVDRRHAAGRPSRD
jgi:RNA polymerase sigma-70 factor (ECF subfamily)